MRKLAWQQKIAKERIVILFDLAEKEFEKHPERSKRYVELARKIGLRCNVRFPQQLKRKFCKSCNSLLIPGKSSSVRISRKALIVKCLGCNKVYRYPCREKIKTAH
ncbi:MAG: ribonuclease P protein component 4 [Candidatus Aenigmarchaeota archaeon]|nr:ribonuclease P protein component 4 [Candidatus Aenigmarchaeota archaeon]